MKDLSVLAHICFLLCMLVALGCSDANDDGGPNSDNPFVGTDVVNQEPGEPQFPDLGGGGTPGDPLNDCIPACSGKTCGEDGCGELCGICTGGGTCSQGVCSNSDQVGSEGGCVPNCENKTCGYDGCEGLCGICTGGFCDDQTGACDFDEEQGGEPANLNCEPGTTCIYPPTETQDVAVTIIDGAPSPMSGFAFPSGVYALVAIEIYPDTLSGDADFPFEVLMNNAGGTHGSAVFAAPHFGLKLELNIYAAFPELEVSTYLDGNINAGGCSATFGGKLFVDLLECYEDELPSFPLPDSFAFREEGDELTLNLSIPPATLIELILDEEYSALATTIFQDDLQILFIFDNISGN